MITNIYERVHVSHLVKFMCFDNKQVLIILLNKYLIPNALRNFIFQINDFHMTAEQSYEYKMSFLTNLIKYLLTR